MMASPPEADPGTLRLNRGDSWFRTGDLGCRGRDGYLFIVGRLKELIIPSGFNVYPAEVETVLNSHPDVARSAVIGRRAYGNQEVAASKRSRAPACERPYCGTTRVNA
jgi:acyl-CoA synthetase (AMP-forming)/AMP-acid ligase II